MPFLVRWPGRVKPGVSDALICLMDFPASFAALAGEKIPAGDAPDSVNVLPALLGDAPNGREKLVEHDGTRLLGFREGTWKFIEPAKFNRPALGFSKQPQLYDLVHDLGETNDLHAIQPKTGARLSQELESVRQAH